MRKDYFLMKYNGIGNDVEVGILRLDVLSLPQLRDEADKDLFYKLIQMLDIQPQDKVGIFELLYETNEFERNVVNLGNPYENKNDYLYRAIELHFPRLSPHVKLVEDLDLDLFKSNGLNLVSAINKIAYDYKLVRYREPADIYRFEVRHGLRRENPLRKLKQSLKKIKLFK